MMRLSDWTFRGELPALPKFVIAVAPHTSNWDFPVGVAALFALDLQAHWFGKESLFRPPMGAALRLIHGRPVRRDVPDGVVAQMAAAVRAEPEFVLAIAPEGTRSSVDHWRSGFYRIAEAAGVPIVPVSFDWSRRVIGINPPVYPSGNFESDIAAMQALYRPEMARHPSGFWRPRALSPVSGSAGAPGRTR
ncbi:MAG: lysophospholipid acyltransferase family protein [Gemmatimonadota bacterium]|nr:lysophospholipid acyltransferase family protein [Gemmatimonadota bacterium]